MTDAKPAVVKRKRNMMRIIVTADARGRKRFVVDLRPLKGEQKFFSTYDKAEAETTAKAKWVELQNGGIAVASISDAIKSEAARCVEVLKPYGATLSEAVAHYKTTVLAFRNAPTIAEVVKEYLKAAEDNGRRVRTIRDLRNRLTKFANAFEGRKLSSIVLKEIETYVGNDKHGLQTRLHTKTKVSQLFNFAKRKGYVSENPTENMEAITPEEKDIQFFTVEQAARLLELASPEMLPAVAVGLFAGLRQSELVEIEWSAFKFHEKVIRIAGKVAKKRSRGLVTINDALAAWLTPIAKTSGKLVPFGISKFEVEWRKLRHAAGIMDNHNNGMRHSFGTYIYAATGDIHRACSDMREKDAVVFLNHYRGLATKPEGERFFSLRPSVAAEKIVAIA